MAKKTAKNAIRDGRKIPPEVKIDRLAAIEILCKELCIQLSVDPSHVETIELRQVGSDDPKWIVKWTSAIYSPPET